MSNRDGYYYYEAGQAVAAAHLRLTIRHVSGDPARRASEIDLARRHAKARMILWLTGMAAERKGVGRADPLRRTRNRLRLRALLEASAAEASLTPARHRAKTKLLVNQAQDRANAICNNLYGAIEKVVERLRVSGGLDGHEIHQIVAEVKGRRLPSADGSLSPRPKSRV